MKGISRPLPTILGLRPVEFDSLTPLPPLPLIGLGFLHSLVFLGPLPLSGKEMSLQPERSKLLLGGMWFSQ